jgi:uncharacterized PurR-regulated membrane protein YhhQ (DUF165 family)
MDVSEKVLGAVGVVVVVIVLLSMTPTVVAQVQDQIRIAEEPLTEWNFTGAEGAIALLGLVPFIWVASILACGAVGMFALAKGGPQT